MGRGLSDLQKTILRLAYENRCENQGVAKHGDVCTAEIIVVSFGIPINEYSIDAGKSQRAIAKGRACSGQNFSHKTIGSGKCDSARSATSRAFGRLTQRGLLVDVGCGKALTESGIEIAKLLPELPPGESGHRGREG